MRITRILDLFEDAFERLWHIEDAVVSLSVREDRREADMRLLVTKVDQLIQAVTTLAEDSATLRARLIEDSSRRGEEIHRHEVALLGHEARLHRLERASSNGVQR